MGVDVVAPTRPLASPTAADRRKRHSLDATDDCPLTMEDLARRRTSIPPNFTYGNETDDVPSVEEDASARRWRSFDVTTSTSTSSRLATLASRIESERVELTAAEQAARPSRRRALAASFRSSARKEQIDVRRMEMLAHVAKCNRSLVVLRDTLTTLELSATEADECSLVEEMDSLDVDAVLADDSVHHILERQLQFLRRSGEMHGDKKLVAPRAVSPMSALEQFLQEMKDTGVPSLVEDVPTTTLVRFEKLMTKYKVLKPTLKRSLDQLTHDTMVSFTRHPRGTAASIWDTRAPQDVLPSLVRELQDSVLETAPVAQDLRPLLHTLLEQMVFTRLAGACYRSLAVELDEQNAQWREQIVKARQLQLDEVGLPIELDPTTFDARVFRQSIDAFNRLPHLVPSSVLEAFLSAVRVLYSEATALLGLSCGCISADVLLPLLVFVLSRTDLPHLHAQVFLMEQFAIDESQDGSEAAYYLACLQAAMGYIMTEVGKPTMP